MTPEDSNIVALIPAYNEAERISNIIMNARRYLPVLVVDDGSSDETFARAKSMGATVLKQIPNQGKGAALRTGFRWAIEQSYQAVITLDADGQHDPAEIPQFLRAYASQGADLIIGKRDFGQMPPVRRLANWLGTKSYSWAVGQYIPDNQSGYRLLSRRMLEAILASQEQGFEFEVEVITTCVRKGYKLDWISIRTIYAGESSHIQPVRHAQNFMRLIWRTKKGR